MCKKAGEPITEEAGSIVIEGHSVNEVMDANSDESKEAGGSTDVENFLCCYYTWIHSHTCLYNSLDTCVVI